jgi:hypothetical protein
MSTNRLGDLTDASESEVICDDSSPTGSSESNRHGFLLRACLIRSLELNHKISGLSEERDPREWASATANPLPLIDLAARWPECSIGA